MLQAAVAVDCDAEPALRLLEHPGCLAPLAACRAAGGLRPEATGAVGNVMLDAIARDVADAAVPVLGTLVLLGALTEQLAPPGWAVGDLALGELVAQPADVVLKLANASL